VSLLISGYYFMLVYTLKDLAKLLGEKLELAGFVKTGGEQELTRSVDCWLEKFAMSISLNSLGLSLAILMKHAK